MIEVMLWVLGAVAVVACLATLIVLVSLGSGTHGKPAPRDKK